jgi:LmbE family N-acetylglucosaminyl deacetylase
MYAGGRGQGNVLLDLSTALGSPRPTVPAVLNFAFIGCHHDDIELGAGVLVQRVLAAGHEVEIVVLTDDADADARHRETIRAALELGIDPESVHFMGFPDGDLTANRETVGAVRALGLDPQVVVTHSAADSHNDHRAANELAFAAFRETVILQYSIHISARLDFAPRFFVALKDESLSSVRKELALGAHGSQHERIMKRDRAQFEAQLGGIAGLPAAEAFELNVQVGGEAHLPELMALNGAPFHSLWYPLLGTEPVVLLYEAFLGQPQSIAEFSRHHESEGRDALRSAFAHHWYPQSPLSERHSSDSEARACVNSGNVILVGSPVNNPITGATFNKLPSIRWITEHDDARESVYLLDKETQRTYHPTRDEGGRLTHDLTVLSILPNPFADHGSLISCAGIHGVGTQALLEFLAAPSSNKDLLNRVLLREERLNLPLTADVNTLALSPFADSPA